MNNIDKLYAYLKSVAEHRGIMVEDNYVSPSDKGLVLKKSLYMLILPGGKDKSFFRAIFLNPELSIESKIQSLSVNLGCFMVKTSKPFPNLKNLRIAKTDDGGKAEVWCEEVNGVRDECPDRFGKRLIAFLNSKLNSHKVCV